GLLHDQAQGKTEELAYSPDKTTANVFNDTDINGLAAAVSEVLNSKGFATGTVGNNDAAHVSGSQVQAAKADDLGAQAVAKDLGGLPVVANASVPAGTVRVVLANDYTGPGAGLSDGPAATAVGSSNSNSANNTAPPPSPILTAGSEHPECVN
ncbi:MAG: LytR C-terminal domain-containing protein, partial [Mycobacterium sp.]|uniref:LytR C-terminal domain-containing protein n=1 Tax=Mycobacterium sp. TaxID=1785 RepID=UPI003C3D215C